MYPVVSYTNLLELSFFIQVVQGKIRTDEDIAFYFWACGKIRRVLLEMELSPKVAVNIFAVGDELAEFKLFFHGFVQAPIVFNKCRRALEYFAAWSADLHICKIFHRNIIRKIFHKLVIPPIVEMAYINLKFFSSHFPAPFQYVI